METRRLVFGVTAVAAVVWASARGADASAGVPLYPNVVEEIPSHLHIQNDHHREWLRFSTTHINVGQWYAPVARRSNIVGNRTAPVPVFWKVPQK